MICRPIQHQSRLILAFALLVTTSLAPSSMVWSQESEDSEEESTAQITRPAPQQSELSQMRLLAKSLPKGQAQWLKVANKYFLAVHIAADSANPKGWVVMLPDAGQLPTWPGSLRALEQFLASKGWHVLSLTLPEPFIPDPPARPKTQPQPAESGSEESDTEEDITEPQAGANEKNEIFDDSTDSIGDGSFIPEEETKTEELDKSDQEQLAQDRIVAALEFISSQPSSGGQLVLYGQGAGAARAASYFSEVGSPAGLTAVILLDAHNNIPHQSSSMASLLSNPNLPVLDIVTDTASEQREEAAERQRIARQNGLRYYEQRTIIAPPYDNTNRVVWGFLSRRR